MQLQLQFIASIFLGISWGANIPGKPLVVLAPPLVTEPYYASVYNDTVDFMISYAKKIIGRDNVVILADEDTLTKIGDQLPPGHVLPARVQDIWMRDFGASIMKNPVLFTYLPDYLSVTDATVIQNSFVQAMKSYGVTPYVYKSTLVTDGGNIVDNNLDTLVTTSRTQKDNPNMNIKAQLRAQTYYPNIVEIEAIPGDTTGHADGMVCWMDTNTLVVSQLDPLDQDYVLKQLKEQLPKDKLIKIIPNKYVDEKWRKFTSACGLHINSLVTYDNVYVPTFGDDPKNSEDGRPYTKAYDKEVLDVIFNITTKNVIQVPVPYNICKMGGSVRCLTWQVVGQIADQIVAAAANYAATNSQN